MKSAKYFMCIGETQWISFDEIHPGYLAFSGIS